MHQRTLINGEWQPDPLVCDDRAIVIHVKHKGLVIVSGYAHSGIINTILYAQKITGIKKILSVIGGFHLSRKEYEKRINRTVESLKRINHTLLVPTPCTGWRGFYALREDFSLNCLWNSVGNLFKF